MTKIASKRSRPVSKEEDIWIFDPDKDCLFSFDYDFNLSFLTLGCNMIDGKDENYSDFLQSLKIRLKEWTLQNQEKIDEIGKVQEIIEIPNSFNESRLFYIRVSLQDNSSGSAYLGILRAKLIDDVSQSIKKLSISKNTTERFLWSVDTDRNILSLSPEFESITGFTMEEGRSLKFDDLFVEEDRKKIAQFTDSNSGTTKNIFQLKRKDEKIIRAKLQIIPTIQSETLIGYSGTLSDISERHHLQVTLDKTLEQGESAKQRLTALLHEKNAILASIPDVIMICDQKGKIIDCRDKNQSEFKNPTEFIGKYLGEIYSQKRTEFFLDAIHSALNKSQPHRIEFRLMNLHQVKCDYDCTITKLQEKKGHVLAVIRNVTENRLIIQELNRTLGHLKKSNEELEQFAFVASHDLQEPTRMISSYLKLLEKHLDDSLDAKSREYIAQAVQNCDKMKNMVFDLLNLSRIEQEPLVKKRIDISELFDPILLTFERISREKEAEIKVERMPRTFCDPALISLVFQNLISNALKFSRPDVKPKISIGAEVLKDKTIFLVEDNGRGIDEKFHRQVFSMFHRGQSPAKVYGTGIGLALCEKIVRRHGGKIWLESTINKGTTVFFTIPEVSKPY